MSRGIVPALADGAGDDTRDGRAPHGTAGKEVICGLESRRGRRAGERHWRGGSPDGQSTPDRCGQSSRRPDPDRRGRARSAAVGRHSGCGAGPEVSRTLTTDLFEQIRSDILHNRLDPGSRLLFRDMRERYRSGLSPLREALMRLVSEGLVLLEDHKGFRVAPVSREEMIDIANTLLELEAIAIRMAVEKGDDRWEAQSSRAITNCRSARCSPATARWTPNGRRATWRFTRRCTKRAGHRR